MSNQRSVGKFCSLTATNITGTSDSIAAFNGALLGEGAEAYCTSNLKVYRFTSATISSFSPLFVPANAGGGTWVMQDSSGFMTCYAVGSATFTAAATGGSPTLGLNFWSEQKSGAGFYSTAAGLGSGLVSVNSTTGLILVDGSLASLGRNVAFQMTMQFSATCNLTGQIFEFDITKASGGNVGNSVQSQTATQSAISGPGGTSTVTVNQIFFPTPGLGYEPVFRCITSGTALLYTAFYQVSITPAGIF